MLTEESANAVLRIGKQNGFPTALRGGRKFIFSWQDQRVARMELAISNTSLSPCWTVARPVVVEEASTFVSA
jgi:hypothetical protein